MSHAIVGCGRVAPNHADAFRSAGVELSWACDRDPDRARELARAFDVPRVTDDLGDVLADPGVRSVSIAVDHAQHAALANDALAAGKHVLLEKPLALDLAEGTKLVETAEELGLVLGVVSQHRYDPVVQQVRSCLLDGVCGRISFVSATLEAGREPTYYTESYWRGRMAEEGGSALINQGYHVADLLTWLFGPLRVVHRFVGTRAFGRLIETEDTVSVQAETSDGAPVAMAVTTGATAMWRSRFDVVGTEGSIEFSIDHPARLTYAGGRAAAVQFDTPEDEPAPGEDYYGTSHRRQAADFCSAVEGHTSLLGSGRAAIPTLELILSMYGRLPVEASTSRGA